ncbi:GGDEF and EAL domain-containing protein [Sulfurimonas sp. HSL3-2]|uniref:EAL domain-containing protein n=1 Tax=Hydrocurvibacter mobilis TaxID=3131936 RepID=UPI0031F77518
MKYEDTHLLLTDSLTYLKSRVSLVQDVLNMRIGNLILIDIDNFNSINNLYGMESGDTVLIETANYIKQVAQERGYEAYRVTSNEFALLDYDAKIDFEDIYEDVQNIIEQMSKYDIYLDAISDIINIHVTIGFATAEDMILEKASSALQHAKKNYLKFSAYSNITNDIKTLSNYIYWNNEIKKAIENDNIQPFFQPILNRDEKIIKHEVLMRLVQDNGAEKTYVSPVQFLDISIQTKRYNELSKIIIFKALNMLKTSENSFSINFAYQDIKNKELIHSLYRFLEENPDVAKRCTFEILESELIEDTQMLLSFINKVRKYGVQIAIDDFGIGFSNLEMILSSQPDIIKIDGSLVKNVDIDSKALTLVEAIVAFSHKMGIKVVAEYVHSKEVYDILKNTDVDMFQGYYFSKPVFTPN